MPASMAASPSFFIVVQSMVAAGERNEDDNST
jgi:hypothetical protein